MNQEKTIVCFGDSNTYGRIAGGGRYRWQTRYPGILDRLIGPDYHVIEEGCGGRTTVFPDPIEPYKCGSDYLLPCLFSHRPVSLVIFMLGTNDTKSRFSLTADDIGFGMERLIQMTRDSRCGLEEQSPKMLLLSPIQLGRMTDLAPQFAGAEAKAEKLPQIYRTLAERCGIPFINAGDYAQPDPRDGVHMDADGHHALAVALYQAVRRILEESLDA